MTSARSFPVAGATPYGREVAAAAPVRAGDAKGRHTATRRELHPLPSGGVLVDAPGLRAVGLWIDPEAVAATFDDVEDLVGRCRFHDCAHDTEPGWAVTAAAESGELHAERLASWRAMNKEAAAAARRANEHERRRSERQFERIVKDAQRRKGRIPTDLPGTVSG